MWDRLSTYDIGKERITLWQERRWWKKVPLKCHIQGRARLTKMRINMEQGFSSKEQDGTHLKGISLEIKSAPITLDVSKQEPSLHLPKVCVTRLKTARLNPNRSWSIIWYCQELYLYKGSCEMKNIKNECNQIIYIKENKIWQIIHTLGQETRAWSNNFRVPIRQT